MKKFLLLTVSAACMTGCAATLTPSGDIYTELLAPTSTVVVEERTVSPIIVEEHTVSPVIVSAPRPVIMPAPRPWAPVNARPHRYAKNPGPRPSRGSGSPKGHRPSGAYFR